MLVISDTPRRAVAYYRHSAEDKQENSVALQREQVEAFAKSQNVRIIAECIDDGVSGVTADRAGFQSLLHEWVNNTESHFEYVFVLDISRFGRWQNPDEAAMYAFRCYMQGKPVITVSRGFPKSGEELLYSMADSIERYSAGKYSKDLSDKVWRGQVKITEQGYSAGGSAPYGLKRVLLDENKQYIQDLLPGQQKAISNQRVTFAPGNSKHVAVVQKVFSLFLNKSYCPQDIADYLNRRHVPAITCRRWSNQAVRAILQNDKYAGRTVYNHNSRKLHAAKTTINKRANWAIGHAAFTAIVTPEQFDKTQTVLDLTGKTDNKVVVVSDELTHAVTATNHFYKDWLLKRLSVCIRLRQVSSSTCIVVIHTVCGGIVHFLITAQSHILQIYQKLMHDSILPILHAKLEYHYP